jgi:hypothetical protein
MILFQATELLVQRHGVQTYIGILKENILLSKVIVEEMLFLPIYHEALTKSLTEA